MLDTLGSSIPALPHAISVSLPTWRDVVGYEEGEKRVVDAMVTGYPRFFIHKSICKLAEICKSKFGQAEEECILCPSTKVADECRSFMVRRAVESGLDAGIAVRVVQFLLHSDSDSHLSNLSADSQSALYVVFFPSQAFPLAKQFWQHTGLGISSRYAEHCLSLLPAERSGSSPTSPTICSKHSKGGNRHYAKKHSISSSQSKGLNEMDMDARESFTSSHTTYLEERYGRNMPLEHGAAAKRTLRRRIAGVLLHDPFDSLLEPSPTGGDLDEMRPSTRGVYSLTEEDVYLHPGGMAAIWSAHQLVLKVMSATAKSVCFGFPYTDTLKILQKWGPGCHHFGNGTLLDLHELESLLEKSPPYTVSALFCEFPSNPLLRTPPLKEIKKLADKYDFLVVVDDTVGNFANVEVLPWADIVATSLTKIFSGDANVIGGSLVLNPMARRYSDLKACCEAMYEDTFYTEDAIFLERNSRDFARRVQQIDHNTSLVTAYLHSQSVECATHSNLKRVWYPKYETTEFYEECRVRESTLEGRLVKPEGGYGGLFSVTFISEAASKAFYDALTCAKGPSLGTNFTLACPYTILAHYAELDWAEQWGVEPALVRVSVGLEPPDELLDMFKTALEAANGA